jgi:hypothetical protein
VRRQRLDRRGLLQTALGTIVGAEDHPILGPLDDGIVKLEPRHAEDDWVVAEAGNVELDIFCMGSGFELDWVGFVGDSAGRDRATVDHFELSWRVLGLELDGMGLGEGGIDKGRGSARVDQRKGRDRGAARLDSDR